MATVWSVTGIDRSIWLLPLLSASVAGVAQLTVPIIALAGGIVFLGENLSLKFALATVIVLGGVAVSVLAPRRKT